MGFPPSRDATGEIDAMNLLAGQCVGLVHQVEPVDQIVRELVEGAQEILEHGIAGLRSKEDIID